MLVYLRDGSAETVVHAEIQVPDQSNIFHPATIYRHRASQSQR